MKQESDLLLGTPLFQNFTREQLEQALGCLGALRRRYAPGESILFAGEPADKFGVLLSGRAQVIREESDGSRAILTEIMPGELFAEAFACASGEKKALPVTVLAVTESAVLLIDYHKIAAVCPYACQFHTRLIENMMGILADKNLILNRRLGHLSKRTTREKLLSYLREQAGGGSGEFIIPFSRQELADYLCVERSAMSAVLSSLREEGALEYTRSRFRLKKAGPL